MSSKIVLIFLVIISIFILYLAAIFIINRYSKSDTTYAVEVLQGEVESIEPSSELTILTWNIGYAGMGKDSDFFLDNGKQLRPPSKQSVISNLDGIKNHLIETKAEILLLQEVPYASWNTYSINVFNELTTQFTNYHWTYVDDLHLKFTIPPFSIRMGNATASRFPISSSYSIPIANEPNAFLHIFKKKYNMHVTHLDLNGHLWSIINIHLSAFDDEKISIREEQLAQILSYAKKEKEAGYHVIIGGDWNLEISESDFGEYSTKQKDLFWIRSLPAWAHIKGFSWVFDPTEPTVRTAEKPYKEGENYTLIIDGFVISDTLEVLEVKTDDLNFKSTDHHPVTGRFKIKNSHN